ncbi:hypothetical protein SEA_IDAHO_1 [Arthrobacter phage Idaho]|uniref:Uncharacterized protein n=1 Tax=Arthrobacter phage Idaho TaxID=2565509 RepID=A0A4D6T834_9CAUD|nr:hypothetical protein QEX67_gp01 [Arthrobacter phage Idaho]QCG78266.1 hypothetical protein SEA_IDAHO_1 [Arthrobacter phage Idaho]
MLLGEIARDLPPLHRLDLLEVCQLLGLDPDDTDLIRIQPDGVEWRNRRGDLSHRRVVD